MDDMVERVGRALSDGGHLGVSLAFAEPMASDGGSIGKLRVYDTERAMAAARAAIEAMRKPTPEMIGQLQDAFQNRVVVGESIVGIVASVIDAALTPSSSKDSRRGEA